jgi:hypothetical protein
MEDDDDNDGPVDPHPSHHDVLRAVSTIVQYISELNDPLAHKIEAVLGSLIRLVCRDGARSTKNTVLNHTIPSYCQKFFGVFCVYF